MYQSLSVLEKEVFYLSRVRGLTTGQILECTGILPSGQLRIIRSILARRHECMVTDSRENILSVWIRQSVLVLRQFVLNQKIPS